jgi:hypothetical protein
MATTDDMITCQTIGHAWFAADAVRRPKLGGNQLTLRCERCDCVREDVVNDRGGQLLGRSYMHPDGYREAGLGFDDRDSKRFWLAKRELEVRRLGGVERPVKAPAKRARKKAS